MYNQDYEDYMRNVLGYSPQYVEPTYRDTSYYNIPNPVTYYNNYSTTNTVNTKLEGMYPEIYRIIYPLIMREVGNNVRGYSEDVIEDIVEKIYNEIDVKYVESNRLEELNKDVKSSISSSVNKVSKTEEIRENRSSCQKNKLLKDIIKILLIREILGGNVRPPMPPPPRPCPGPGPCPGPRPPFYYN